MPTMARRCHMPRRPDSSRSYRNGPQPCHLPIHPAVLEEKLEVQHRDMQKIIAENQLVVDDNTLLQRELMAVKDEIHALSQIVPELQAEKETRIRELIQRKLKLEAELRAFEPLKTEVMHLRAEVEELSSLQKELTAQVQYLTRDMARAEDEKQLLASLRAQIDGMHREIAEARSVLQYEKKAEEEQVALRQLLEDNLISLACGRERLRAELTNADRRTEGIGGGSCDSWNGSPNNRHPAGAYGNKWSDACGSYNKRDPHRR